MNTPEWTLQDRIRKAREHADLTQVEFAERLGVSRNTLNRWEGGIYSPADSVIRQIAQVANIPLDWFYVVDESSTVPLDRLDSPTPPERVVLEWNGDGYTVAQEGGK
ncbi:helix-turn-helix transcriptional regulator [uncultured Rothia sp.]|uniref:helix-turn-helix domain-containing protein n=1 Tax=uncultured Rothia sp. TaxID=316088 RepID=UPI003217FB7A